MESIYSKLRRDGAFDPSVIKKDAKEVIFNLVSCMCDNRNQLHFKKNPDGEFRVSMGISAISNLQMKCSALDLIWVADEGDWELVSKMINSGTSVIDSVKSR